MSNVFSRAAQVMFANQDRTVTATYSIAATGEVKTGIRLLRSQPGRTEALFGQELATGTTTFRVLASNIAAPADGDAIEIAGGERFVVQGQPMLDDLGVWWLLDTVPA